MGQACCVTFEAQEIGCEAAVSRSAKADSGSSMIAEVLPSSSRLPQQSPNRSPGCLLLVDTCGGSGTIALAHEAELLASDTLPGRSASERLLPAIRALLAGQGRALADLGAIAIVHGPGSFTGMRIGLSAAKGLAEALGLQVIAISRLAVLAAKAASQTSVIALLNAGRGEFYTGQYRDGNCVSETLGSIGQVLSLAQTEPRPAVITCDAEAAAVFAAAGAALVPELTAADALPIAAARAAARSFSEIATIDAHYVRRSDAEIFIKQGAPRRE